MAKPASARKAVQQAQRLLIRRLPGARRTTVHAHLIRAGTVALSLYRRWQVGPYQWRVKHLRWFLEHQMNQLEPGVRYRYWLTVRLLVIAIGREADWLPRLQGPWTHPSGRLDGKAGAGRPLKRPT